MQLLIGMGMALVYTIVALILSWAYYTFIIKPKEKNYELDNLNELMFSELELKKIKENNCEHIFYDYNSLIKDGKNYKKICVQCGKIL